MGKDRALYSYNLYVERKGERGHLDSFQEGRRGRKKLSKERKTGRLIGKGQKKRKEELFLSEEKKGWFFVYSAEKGGKEGEKSISFMESVRLKSRGESWNFSST